MATNEVDLAQLFQAVSKVMEQNQAQLNNSDTYNHDHGDNMVDIFSTIANAVQQNRTATPARQLRSAASQLRTKKSGSAQYYSKSLEQAARELSTAKTVDAGNAATLIQTILGGGQSTKQTGSTVTDMLSTLLGSLTGGTPTSGGSGTSAIDWATLASAGMEYMQSKQEGKDTLTALMDALMAEPNQQNTYRKDSGTLVATTLMQALGNMLSKKSR
jgi:hypothetical protein